MPAIRLNSWIPSGLVLCLLLAAPAGADTRAGAETREIGKTLNSLESLRTSIDQTLRRRAIVQTTAETMKGDGHFSGTITGRIRGYSPFGNAVLGSIAGGTLGAMLGPGGAIIGAGLGALT